MMPNAVVCKTLVATCVKGAAWNAVLHLTRQMLNAAFEFDKSMELSLLYGTEWERVKVCLSRRLIGNPNATSTRQASFRFRITR